MAEVIKLTDKYIDASDIYDVNQSRTQQDINSSVNSSIQSMNSNLSTLNHFPYGLTCANVSINCGTSWDGTAKTGTITVPQDGTYLVFYRAHICGAGSITAGSNIYFSGYPIFPDYLGSCLPLANVWDKYTQSCHITYLSQGTVTISVAGEFKNCTSDSYYGSLADVNIYRLCP